MNRLAVALQLLTALAACSDAYAPLADGDGEANPAQPRRLENGYPGVDKRQDAQREYNLQIANLLRHGDSKANVRLEPGDVIIIPESMF